MIAVDTNILIRALVDRTDNPEQQRRARAALLAAEQAGEAVFLSNLVVAETVWVLKSVGRLGKHEIAALLEGLLALPLVHFEDRIAVVDGVQAMRSGGAGMAEQLIRGSALRGGARVLLTFDAELLELGGCAAP